MDHCSFDILLGERGIGGIRRVAQVCTLLRENSLLNHQFEQQDLVLLLSNLLLKLFILFILLLNCRLWSSIPVCDQKVTKHIVDSRLNIVLIVLRLVFSSECFICIRLVTA